MILRSFDPELRPLDPAAGMNLYDDDDEAAKPAGNVAAGWAQGVRASKNLLPKKTGAQPQGLTPNSKSKEVLKSKTSNVMAPVKEFKKQKVTDGGPKLSFNPANAFRGGDSLIPLDVPIDREYDPMWPNDYEKVKKDVLEVKSRNKAVSEIAAINKALGVEVVDPEEKRLKYLAENKKAAQSRFNAGGGGAEQMSAPSFAGFGRAYKIQIALPTHCVTPAFTIFCLHLDVFGARALCR